MLHCPQKKLILANCTIKYMPGSTSTSVFFVTDILFFCSILAQNFSIDPIFGKADMGSLVHPRDGGKAAAVSVPCFQSDLVAEVRNG